MKKQGTLALTMVTALLGGALAGTVQAEGVQPAGRTLRPMLGLGITVGGGHQNVHYIDPETEEVLRKDRVRFGEFWQAYGGLEYQVAPQFSLQATLNYHYDSSSNFGGLAKFSRYPVEVLGHYHRSNEWRFGGGLRYVTSAKFIFTGENLIGDPVEAKFENTTGLVLETEYRVLPSLGVKLRYVAERYKVKRESQGVLDGNEFDGNHMGLMLTWYL